MIDRSFGNRPKSGYISERSNEHIGLFAHRSTTDTPLAATRRRRRAATDWQSLLDHRSAARDPQRAILLLLHLLHLSLCFLYLSILVIYLSESGPLKVQLDHPFLTFG